MHLKSKIGPEQYDAVALQEMWVAKDIHEMIRAGTSAGLEHSRYFQSSGMGPGLLFLSRHPIESASFHR